MLVWLELRKRCQKRPECKNRECWNNVNIGENRRK